MKRIIKVECDCKLHEIKIEDNPIDTTPNAENCLAIAIYEHRSGNTGKILKRPKLLADVVLFGDERKKFLKQIRKIEF
ncbi:MAG: hypothetical protein ACTSPD_10330 [Promethearchaeota archaeon]